MVPVCTVRQCALPLAREPGRYVCAKGHSFDLARSGYCNLLQPQDRRSREPGDTRAAVEARRRFVDRGFAAALQRGIAEMLPRAESILDAGCGEGSYLASFAAAERVGIDISTAAIELAAKRHRDVQWFVANADRFVPFADGSFDLVTSITARMNAPEFRRVLRDDGHLLVAVSAPDDLIEIGGAGRDRVERTVETFAERFTLIEQRRITTVAELDEEAARDILTATYRPRATSASAVTLSLEALLFRAAR